MRKASRVSQARLDEDRARMGVSEQQAWHYKPAGWSGAPCPVCGCPAPRLQALHRALTAEESWKHDAFAKFRGHGPILWIKSVKVAFGTDWRHDAIAADGTAQT